MTLKTDYKNITWTGLRKYRLIENQDGTVSFLDVTEYLNTEDAQVLASDLNTNNDLVNRIMAGEFFYTEGEVDSLLQGKQDTLTFDDVPTTSSSNPVKSDGIKSALDAVNSRIDNLSVFSIHVCGQGEYDPSTGQPTIQNPDASTFYLVPTGSSPDVFTEWIYVNNSWEVFGSAQVDLSNYVTTTDLQTALSDKQDTLTFDTVPATSSSNPVTSDGIATALLGKSDTSHNHDSRYYTEAEMDTLLAGKEDTLTFDTVPATSSSNPVTSDGIATALLGKSDTSHNHDSRYYTESEVDTLLSAKADNTSLSEKVNKSGDTMSGILDVKNNIRIHDASITYGTAPSSDVWGHYLVLCDKNNSAAGTIREIYRSSGMNQLNLSSQNTGVENYIRLNANLNGTQSVNLSSKTAWRDALGLSYLGDDTGWISLSGSSNNGMANGSIIYYRVLGVLVQVVCYQIKLRANLTSTYVNLVTNGLSSYKPKAHTYIPVLDTAGAYAYILSDSGTIRFYKGNNSSWGTDKNITFNMIYMMG